jgi:hypothetical protein
MLIGIADEHFNLSNLLSPALTKDAPIESGHFNLPLVFASIGRVGASFTLLRCSSAPFKLRISAPVRLLPV